ncbi:hypothetical protein ACSQ67_025467 [Phaseolus vulgaris]
MEVSRVGAVEVSRSGRNGGGCGRGGFGRGGGGRGDFRNEGPPFEVIGKRPRKLLTSKVWKLFQSIPA